MSSPTTSASSPTFSPLYKTIPNASLYSDLPPLPQDDGPEPHIVSIAYTEAFREGMDLFRRVLERGEMSERYKHKHT